MRGDGGAAAGGAGEHRGPGDRAGLLLAAHIGGPAAPVIGRMMERGALVCSAGANAVRFVPPYVITAEEVDELVGVFAGSL